MKEEFEQSNLSDKLFQKIRFTFNNKQELLNRQLEESERKFKQQQEEKENIDRKAEEKFLQNMDKNQKQIEKISDKFFQQLEKNRIKPEIIEEVKTRLDLLGDGKTDDYILEIDIENHKQEDIEHQIDKLQILIQDAGFSILERSDKKIKIDLSKKLR
jgi:hypothetical protein